MKSLKKFIKKHALLLIVLIVAGLTGWGYFYMQNANIKSYADCAAAGYPIMESYPQQCQTPDGRNFVQDVQVPQSVIKKVRVKGEIVCLPHKDKEGPQTLECAHGLKDEEGKYYALRYTDPNSLGMASLPTGEVVVIEGNLQEETDTQYDIVGGIDVISIEK